MELRPLRHDPTPKRFSPIRVPISFYLPFFLFYFQWRPETGVVGRNICN